MAKGKPVVFLIAFLILSALSVSADLYIREEIDKSYTTDYDVWYYKEDLYGKEKGFVLKHYSSSPKYSYVYEDDYPYVSWAYIEPYRYYDRDYKPYVGYYDRDYRDVYYNLELVLNTYKQGRDRYYYKYPYRSSGYYSYYRNYW